MAGSNRRRALLLMDFQQAVCGPSGVLGVPSGASGHTAARQVLPRVQEALRRARRTDDFIVHVRVGFDEDGLRRVNRSQPFLGLEQRKVFSPGSAGFEFCPQAQPEPGELVVTKACVSPFAGTGLDDILRAQRADHLLLAGVATNFVVESAARHAGDAGYAVDVIEDLCAAHSEEMHQFAVRRTLPLFGRIATLNSVYPGA
ncbi:cysteine hydrolase family protein [Streptomyces chartreusis]|uniref:cysteine hydrolase family protein n=1 Tax=Streptomyces chartreusis TaxID=1969 RepID=UPI00342C2405